MTSSLTLTTSNRLEILADALAEDLSSRRLDPMVPEVVVVQSRGMERWLRLELARRLGVAANIDFPFPNLFLARTLESVFPGVWRTEVYERDALTWRLVRLLPTLRGEDGYADLTAYLAGGEGEDDARLYHLARVIADTLDQYLLYRPEMIREWEAGGESDWQAQLWRAVTRDVAASLDGKGAHRAVLERLLLDRLSAPTDPPPTLGYRRVSVFGVSVLPPLHLRLLTALSARVDVRLYVMNPSSEYWAQDLSEPTQARIARREASARPEDLVLSGGNPLLSSLGRLGAEFLDLIVEMNPQTRELYQEPEGRPGAAPGEGSLLHTIQSDILHAREPEPAAPPAGDDSLCVVSCHSATREAEVLRDFLLDLFDRRPELGPGDVLVMTPRIAEYAPALEAVFEAPEGDGQRIPIAVSDRPLLEQTGIARTVFRILGLPESRCAATEILALAADPAVQAHFGIQTSDLEMIAGWLDVAAIRWGLDAAHRAELGLPAVSENTWMAGLDRLLLGYALSPARGELDESLYAGVAPATGAEGSRSVVLGALVELVETVRRARAVLGCARVAEEWPGVLRGVLASLLGDTLDREGDAESISAGLRNLERSIRAAGAGPSVLGVGAPRAALREGLTEERSGARFLTGRLTICEMLPMRSIPAEVICLVGMNDDVFPARSRPPGFDHIARSPRKGDRSRPRSDRYLFLETILSARSVLYISYVGQSIRDNAVLPPAVPVSLLLDYVEKLTGATPGASNPGRVIRHPLQPFSPRYLTGDPGLFTYSEHNALAAAELAGSTKKDRKFCPAPLPPEETATLDLAELNRFFRNPAKYFVHRRLGFRLERWETGLTDREDFVLRQLSRYGIGDEVARMALEGPRAGRVSADAALRLFRAQGRLPHGLIGELELEALLDEVEELRLRVREVGDPAPVTGRALPLPVGATTLSVILPPVAGAHRVAWRWGALRPTDRIGAWLTHLCSCALDPGSAPGGTIFVATNETLVLAPVEQPLRPLEDLLKAYRTGSREPLEFFPDAAMVFAQTRAKGDDEGALRKAQYRFDPSRDEHRESDDPYVQLCFGKGHTLTDTFGGLASLVWGPLLAAGSTEAGPA